MRRSVQFHVFRNVPPKLSFLCRGGSRILLRGGEGGVLTPEGCPEPNICSKLPENCIILENLGGGQGRPAPTWILKCYDTGKQSRSGIVRNF